MAGQYRFKDQNGNIVAQISASVEGTIAFSGSVVDFTQANNIILGNVQLAGTASNALLLDGFDSQAFAFTSSIHPFTASIAGTNTFTSSATARLNSIETISASNVSRLNAVETITASNIARLNSIETITSSNLARLNSLEIKTGSLATTGSNTFIGTQTITGSLYISSDLIVQGSSSLQNITASAVSIGTNIINLNTANPAIRYAGLSIGDSGSIGSSGSFLYDSVQDEMIFIHRGANTTVTSSVVLMGPQTFDNIGGETYPTLNIVQKGTGNEHLVDSCIFDNGTTTCVKNNFVSTGTICSAGTICGLTINSNGVVTGNDFYNGLAYPYNTNFGSGADASTTTIRAGSTNGYQSCITLQGAGCIIINTSSSQRVNITSTGIACFSCQICAPSFIGGTLSGTSATITNAGTACTITDVLTLTNAQSGFSSICAGASILFTSNGGATLARIYSRGNMNSNNGSDLVFQTQISAGGGPQCTMVINGGSQNVGIGTFTPTDKLDIYGNDTNGAIVIRGGSSQTGRNIYLFSGGINATGTLLGVTKCVNQFIYTNNSRLTIGTADAHSLGFSTSDTLRAIIDSAGTTCFACPISVPRVFQRPSDLTVTCNMTSFRSLNLAHQGAAGYIDINPVRLFDLPYQGGMFFIQITTWQRRYEYGIINWVDNGSNVPIIAVNYTTISCNPGASTPIQISATVPNPGSDNIIRIYICNMHSNGHGYSGMIYAVS